ncbi:MAG: S1-C subfamily serine protease, partial [Pseudohongiellaceae bacterium]
MKKLTTFAALYFFSLSAASQPAPPVGDSNSLEAYLLQAFVASQAPQRAPLFHIGIEAQQHVDGYLVTAVLEDYPAFYAGINRGDVIVNSNGGPFHPIESFNNDVSAQYDLTIDRAGSRFVLTVTPVF